MSVLVDRSVTNIFDKPYAAIFHTEMKMEAKGSSTMYVTFYQISCHDIQEDCSINMCHCKNLKSQRNLLVALCQPLSALMSSKKMTMVQFFKDTYLN